MTMMAIGIATSVASLGIGAYQMVDADKKATAAQKALDDKAKNSPLYKPDKSIQDYYQQSLNQFLQKPTDSLRYQLGSANAKQLTSQLINSAQDRRSAIGGIGKIAYGQNNAMQGLLSQEEAEKRMRLQALGGATNMLNQDKLKQYDFNQLTPYNRSIGLDQLKAQAAGQQYNAGMQMVGQGISTAGTVAAAGYKSGAGGSKTPTGTITDSMYGGGTTTPSNVPGSNYMKFNNNTDFSKYFPK